MSYMEEFVVFMVWEVIVLVMYYDLYFVFGLYLYKDVVDCIVMLIRVCCFFVVEVVVVFGDGSWVGFVYVVYGIWEVQYVGLLFFYCIVICYVDQDEMVVGDFYCYVLMFGEFDLYLIVEGWYECFWEVLGVYLYIFEGECGVLFVVWVLNVIVVWVVGDYNGWNGEMYVMCLFGGSGVWELFIFDLLIGICYKYQICMCNGDWILKVDLMVFVVEVLLDMVLVVIFLFYEWLDGVWMIC